MKNPKLAFFLIIALLLAAPLYAEIYRYIDENGQKRWTDDLSQVPEQQRAGVQRIETEPETPEKAKTEKAEETQSGSSPETKAAASDTGTESETDVVSREALEKEKAELDLLYQQLMEERKQIEKFTPEPHNFKAQAEQNDRITAFNEKTEQYEARLAKFNEKIDAFNQQIMSKQSSQNE
jgi:hypothetical protein